MDAKLPIEVISTGLSYLLVPVSSGLAQAKICMKEFESFLAGLVLNLFIFLILQLLNVEHGIILDFSVATGSAAGPLCAYLLKHKAF